MLLIIPLALASTLEGEVLKTLFQLGISFHQPVERPDTSNLNWQETVIRWLDSLRSRAGVPSEVTPMCLSKGCSHPHSLVFPRARKWASNSADLGAKVLDPSFTSVRSALKSAPRLPSPPPSADQASLPSENVAGPPSENAAVSALQERPQVSALQERPQVSALPERPQVSALPERPPRKCPPVPAPRKCPPVPAPRKCPPVPAPRKCPPVPAPRKCPPVPAPRKCPPVPAPRKCPPVPAPRKYPPVPAPHQQTPEPAPRERPQVSAPDERPQVSAPAERPQVPDGAPIFPKEIFGGVVGLLPKRPRRGLGPRSRRRSSHGRRSPPISHGHRSPRIRHGCPSALHRHGLPDRPWPPELPAPPWVPKRAPPWRPPVLSCLRVPWGLQSAPPPPVGWCTVRDAPFGRGEYGQSCVPHVTCFPYSRAHIWLVPVPVLICNYQFPALCL